MNEKQTEREREVWLTRGKGGIQREIFMNS